ncbi:MAG: flagellar motor protein MotB [Planctomycetota bacterium]
MARKKKPPPEKPSKAYLVSFGDTMTALLAFFIVLNSFAKEQTGANMHSGTGSFMNAVSTIGLPGGMMGDRSQVMVDKKAPSPIYAVQGSEERGRERLGPDDDPDNKRIIDRQTEEFKRFLNNVSKQFDIKEMPPTKTQIVFDSFEKLNRDDALLKFGPLKRNGIRIASEAIMKLPRDDFRMEVVVWANMPSKNAMIRATETSVAIKQQILTMFTLTREQRERLVVSAKPWLFSDAARPKLSFVISKLDLDEPLQQFPTK